MCHDLDVRRKYTPRKSIILFIAIVIGLFVGFLLIPQVKDLVPDSSQQNQPMPTAPAEISTDNSRIVTTAELLDENNWIEYRDDEYDFTFSYPKDFVTDVFNEGDQKIDLYMGIDFGRSRAPHRTLNSDDIRKIGYTISVNIDRVKTYKEVIADFEQFKDRNGYKKVPFKIQNRSGYRFEYTALDSFRKVVVFEKNNAVYQMMLAQFITDDASTVLESNQIYERMVQSIRF